MADGTIYIDTAIDENSIEKEMKDTERAIRKAEERLDKLIEKQIRFVETGGDRKSRAFQGMEYDIAQASASLDAMKVKYADMQNVMSAKKVGVIRGAFRKLGTVLGNVGRRVFGIGKNAKTSNRSLMKMMATSLLMGLAFMALMAIINGLKEGINNLAQYSGDVNEDLSALKSSLTQLKNSFATAFAPILSVVTPILTSFLNLLSSVITKVGMFFSALSGKSTFTKAIAVQEDYAASLSDTADATKKVTDYSTSLDEINKASSNDSSKSSKGSVSPSEMFEEVEMPSGLQIVADKIGQVFGKVVEKIRPHLVNIKGMFKGLGEFIAGVFTGDTERALDGLKLFTSSFADEVALMCDQTIGALTKLDEFIQNVFKIDWVDALGVCGGELEILSIGAEGVWNGLELILIGILDFIAGVFTGDWERAWKGVKEIFRGIFDSIVAIAKIPINEIIRLTNGFVKGFISGLNLVIKALNKISFKLPDWLEHVPGASKFAGKELGFNIKTITAPTIPYLATGAVIPPNAPFMAMLGDQKRGTNIEAPLDTIKQAVAEVIGNTRTGGGSYTFIGQINRRTLFEEVISEAKVHQLNTGNNPFELA